MRDSIRSTHAVSSLIDLFEWYYPLVSPQFLNINSIDTKFTIQTRHGNRGNGMFKSEIGEEISAKGKYLGVVGLETSPGNKPRRRARFVVVVINDLGRNVARRCRAESAKLSLFRRIEGLLKQLDLHAFCLSSCNRRCRITRIIGRRFRDTRIHIRFFFFFFRIVVVRLDVRNGDEKMRKVFG